ncbi:unnamed protein product [Parnassius apollo]|uniref:(apollo) hypothetical protein n=1 Tax=Parnassius apollo TaxID=110799 RepID=A0A8S3X3M1_PARAO|nr:unnamed protein product [Parnassius apollo]
MLVCNKNLEEIDTRVTKLENRMEELSERDQDLLANDLEISGLPEQKGEVAINTVILCARKLGLDIDHREIVHAERVGILRKSIDDINSSQEEVRLGPRRIMVRMSRRALREEFLRSARVRRTVTTE